MRDQVVDVEFLEERRRILEESLPLFVQHLPTSAYSVAHTRFDLVKVHYGLGTSLEEVAAMFRQACIDAIETGLGLSIPGSTYPIVAMLRLFGEDELREQLKPHLRRSNSESTWRRAAAAIAQMFGIDDSSLEGHKYYPYDIAHYLD